MANTNPSWSGISNTSYTGHQALQSSMLSLLGHAWLAKEDDYSATLLESRSFRSSWWHPKVDEFPIFAWSLRDFIQYINRSAITLKHLSNITPIHLVLLKQLPLWGMVFTRLLKMCCGICQQILKFCKVCGWRIRLRFGEFDGRDCLFLNHLCVVGYIILLTEAVILENTIATIGFRYGAHSNQHPCECLDAKSLSRTSPRTSPPPLSILLPPLPQVSEAHIPGCPGDSSYQATFFHRFML